MRNQIVAVIVVILGTASGSALAQAGQIFVNGSLGQSHFGVLQNGMEGKTDTSGALRLGYLWHGPLDYGVEAGYVDLGGLVQGGSYTYTNLNGQPARTNYRNSWSARGWLLGGNLKYNFESFWYLSARGGWFQAKTTTKLQFDGERWRFSSSTTRGYVGLGTGCNLSRSWSLGVNYDYYDLGGSSHVNVYSATAEYRF